MKHIWYQCDYFQSSSGARSEGRAEWKIDAVIVMVS